MAAAKKANSNNFFMLGAFFRFEKRFEGKNNKKRNKKCFATKESNEKQLSYRNPKCSRQDRTDFLASAPPGFGHPVHDHRIAVPGVAVEENAPHLPEEGADLIVSFINNTNFVSLSNNCNMKNGPISQKITGYDNIFWLGEKKSLQTHVLYKYMNVKYAIEFLRTGRFLMNEPSAWSDPYERRFYTADYSNIEGFKPHRIHCTCFTQKCSNEAAWRMYSSKDTGIASRTVRFEFRRSALLQALDRGLDSGRVYLGNASYDYTSKQIDGLHLKKNPLYQKHFSSFSLDKFLNLLLIKRKAFEYEQEVRMFLVGEDAGDIWDETGIEVSRKQFLVFPTEIMQQMIKSISVDPICDDLEYNMIKTSIMSVFPYTRCIKHGLYKSKPRIIIE